MSKGRSLTSSVLQGSAVESVLLKVFFKHTYSESECILSKSADNRKLNGAVDMPENRGCQDAIQRDMVKLKK